MDALGKERTVARLRSREIISWMRGFMVWDGPRCLTRSLPLAQTDIDKGPQYQYIIHNLHDVLVLQNLRRTVKNRATAFFRTTFYVGYIKPWKWQNE